MAILVAAMWRRLDLPGHDVCRLYRRPDGWTLQGTAVFRHESGPACLRYHTECNAAWETTSGEVTGFLGDRDIAYRIERERSAWTMNGIVIGELAPYVDLDYGFTPATNYQQLRRVDMSPGQAADVPAAWLDVDAGTLTALPQRYERISESEYRYAAPTFQYEGVLAIAPNGFVSRYPGLWEME